MAVFANSIPEGWEPGDFLQIEDEEFMLASEPSGLIAIVADNDQGYLTLAAARRLYECLRVAIENGEWVPHDDEEHGPAADGRTDDDLPF